MSSKATLFLLAVGLVACSEPPETELSEQMLENVKDMDARAIHERILTVDTHDDIPFDFATRAVDPGVRSDKRQVDIPKMIEGGLDAAFFVVYVPQAERTEENYRKARSSAMVKFNAIHRMTQELYPNKIELARQSSDVSRIRRKGKLVACIGIENGFVIGKEIEILKRYYGLGARYMTLAHGGHNDIADSATPLDSLGDGQSLHDGLSEFGSTVVREMNRLGMMVDVPHISKKAMMDAVGLSRAPVIASHSAVRSLCDHPRNLDDEQLLTLRENGGVIQIVSVGSFVKRQPMAYTEALRKLREELGITTLGPAGLAPVPPEQRDEAQRRLAALHRRWPETSVADFVDHIDYAVNLIGIDHVGISSDFDGGGGIRGWNDASETGNVTFELLRRKYDEEEIAKLWGGNLLRVWAEAERVASSLQSKGENGN